MIVKIAIGTKLSRKAQVLFMNVVQRLYHDESGVLAFEWVLLLTLLVIGIVSGMTAARDGLISELVDIAEAAVAIDQSYSVATNDCGGNSFSFPDDDDPDEIIEDCKRGSFVGQPAIMDCDVPPQP